MNEKHPQGQYLLSSETLKLAESYLTDLRRKKVTPGKCLASLCQFDPNDMDGMDLVTALMNSRKAAIYSESESVIDGSDWTAVECEILGGITYNTLHTHAFNDGAHDNRFRNHQVKLPVNFIYTASALLRNDHGQITPDMRDVIRGKEIDEDAYYRLYEKRLLPALIAQNNSATKPLVINIPGLGLGQFCTDKYRPLLRKLLPNTLKKLFQNHADKLKNIHVVNYDPYSAVPDAESESAEMIAHMRFQIRPLQASAKPANQLEFPKDGTDYSDYQLVKIVAWDHFSWPGNDIWRNSRSTDDGVSAGSSDVLLAMANSGEFGRKPCFSELEYNKSTGIAYALNPENKSVFFSYSSLIQHHYPFAKEIMRVVDCGIAFTEEIKLSGTSATGSKSVPESESKTRPIIVAPVTAEFQLQCLQALLALGLALFALAVLTSTPIATTIGIASAYTANISLFSSVGSIAALLGAAGLYAYRHYQRSDDATPTKAHGL